MAKRRHACRTPQHTQQTNQRVIKTLTTVAVKLLWKVWMRSAWGGEDLVTVFELHCRETVAQTILSFTQAVLFLECFWQCSLKRNSKRTLSRQVNTSEHSERLPQPESRPQLHKSSQWDPEKLNFTNFTTINNKNTWHVFTETVNLICNTWFRRGRYL